VCVTTTKRGPGASRPGASLVPPDHPCSSASVSRSCSNRNTVFGAPTCTHASYCGTVSTTATRKGKPGNDHSHRRHQLRHHGDRGGGAATAGEFAIDAIVTELWDKNGGSYDFDKIDHDTFWAVVGRHAHPDAANTDLNLCPAGAYHTWYTADGESVSVSDLPTVTVYHDVRCRKCRASAV